MNTKTIPSGSTAETNRPASSTPATGTRVESYLFFDGRCEEALDFYRKALGAEVVMLMRFKDAPDPNACGPVGGDKIMHASFRVGDTMVLASDGRCEGKPSFQGFGLSLTLPSTEEANRRFASLAESGQVVQPLSQTFFAKRFGMVTDRFGVMWMVIVLP